MGSITEYAKVNKKNTFAIIAAVVMIILGSSYIINSLNHKDNSLSINLAVSLTGSIPNMTARTDIKVGWMNPFALSTTSTSPYANNFILRPSNATFLITAVNSSLANFNTQYVANNATSNSTLLSMINQQQSFMPINDRSMEIEFDHSLNNSWDYSIPFTDLYNNLSQGWRLKILNRMNICKGNQEWNGWSSHLGKEEGVVSEHEDGNCEKRSQKIAY